jgi:hypothetical protein
LDQRGHLYQRMTIKNPTYDKLKFCAQVLLPALGTLYFTVAGIWNLPAAEQIVGTIVAIDTFLGVALQLSANSYKANQADITQDRIQGGILNITETGDTKLFSLELGEDPVIFEDKKEVVFKVKVAEGEHE